MAFCPNCGTQYAERPLRCQCGYLFGSAEAAAHPASLPLPDKADPAAAGRFEFHGDGGELAILHLKLILFSILTLGIYSFWGRTEIRRYLWSKVRFTGQAFSYHGTGREILFGWLKFFGLMALLYGTVLLIAMYAGEMSNRIVLPLIYLGIGLLVPVAVHGALRYRYSRTEWQGRRFSYRGNLFELAGIFWLGAILTAVTLSIYLPYFLNSLRKYIADHSWYAGHRFQFSGEGRAMLWPYVKFLLLFLPTLTLYRFWNQARQTRYYWSKTSFAGVPFASSVSGDGLLILTIVNGILTFCTLGIAYPWALCRLIRYTFENLRLESLPNIALADTKAEGGDAFGDALGAVIGTDAGIDAGFGL